MSANRLGFVLVLACLILYVWIDSRLAPAWTSDQALWQRVVDVSPNQARAYNNLGVAWNKAGDDRAALRMFATARQVAKSNGSIPYRERAAILVVADQNLVSILARTQHPDAAIAATVTDALEEMWQLQQQGFGVPR